MDNSTNTISTNNHSNLNDSEKNIIEMLDQLFLNLEKRLAEIKTECLSIKINIGLKQQIENMKTNNYLLIGGKIVQKEMEKN